MEWADPFPLQLPGGEPVVFIEEYVRANHRGRISVVHLDDSERGWRRVETVLDLPTHLSYPLVFQWAGAWYLMPEQAATGGLQLYTADDFPSTWRWHSTALAAPAADATIAEIDGTWWLFTAMNRHGGNAADELHLFHGPSPIGPWTAHRRNPVVSDVRTARPGGRIYRSDGVWYRVAQNGALSYGHSLMILRIDRIDQLAYHETAVDTILPNWAPGLMATHTINQEPALTAVDALRAESRVRVSSRFSRLLRRSAVIRPGVVAGTSHSNNDGDHHR